MPNTGARRETTARVNAKEAETVQQSQKPVSKTEQLSASGDERSLVRSARALKGRSRDVQRDTRFRRAMVKDRAKVKRIAATNKPRANGGKIHPMSSHYLALDSGALGRFPW
jgi:hypothetical protein